MIEQKYFVLTIDMVPIDVDENCTFTCPLPKGYKEIVKNNLKEIDAIPVNSVSGISTG